ncbi:ABC transporter ATP-binding protein [Eubacterium barkeri]|uniref:ABC-2 type transport system ATP-binding protein n=1 Tax=Eubacterium barkeri TaxID=1528 RepID=A0A1H3ETG1_EUBBA|nr:ABC transporter ATP-binding protein [Eubacterium barkeri]SDX81857.1 ABC-2 type transport system ATP-binding protein [Eubacterium barkeri]
MDIVQTQDLRKRYGKVDRVCDLSLHVPEKKVYGFLGPNGAGKTTTLKMILGLIHPSDGGVTLFGQPMDGKNRLSLLRDVGSLIESPSYYGHLTGLENMVVAARMRGLGMAEIHEALGAVRLSEAKDRRVREYSLGMKQRLGLAIALLGRPRLMILDEPTNGLDPAGIQEIRELIISLPARYGMTVLISSHLLSEIDQMADVVGVINEGQLIFEDKLSVLHALSQGALAIRTTDNPGAEEILTAAKVDWHRSEDYLLLNLLKDDNVARLSQTLVSKGIGLLRMEERQSSLEDIFLRITGGAVSL